MSFSYSCRQIAIGATCKLANASNLEVHFTVNSNEGECLRMVEEVVRYWRVSTRHDAEVTMVMAGVEHPVGC